MLRFRSVSSLTLIYIKEFFWKAARYYIKYCSLCMLLTFVVQLMPALFDGWVAANGNEYIKCEDLLMGQYLCPDFVVDSETQQAKGCSKESLKAPVWCTPAPGIVCDGLFDNGTFKMDVPCKWTSYNTLFTIHKVFLFVLVTYKERFMSTVNTKLLESVDCKKNGHSFETSLLLSIFLGMFGVDRFYLGYPAIGLVKFATLGLMFIGQLIDILLIATQVMFQNNYQDD